MLTVALALNGQHNMHVSCRETERVPLTLTRVTYIFDSKDRKHTMSREPKNFKLEVPRIQVNAHSHCTSPLDGSGDYFDCGARGSIVDIRPVYIGNSIE
jgi:hypothetical protein